MNPRLKKSFSKKRQNLSKKIKDRIPDHLKNKEKRVRAISSLLPNMATLLALCAGLSAVRFALESKWELAVISILVAGILDATDGKLARLLGSSSRFGAELDSLSDFISFGVSPALVIYLHTLHLWHGMGWILTLFFTVCMGLRLARFNTLSIEGHDTSGDGFFLGTPAPAAALITLSPLMFSFISKEYNWPTATLNPYFYGFIVFSAACLMVSRIPTFSIKKIHVPSSYIIPLMLGIALLVGALYVEPWLVLSLISWGYLLSIPLSIYLNRKIISSKNPFMKNFSQKSLPPSQET